MFLPHFSSLPLAVYLKWAKTNVWSTASVGNCLPSLQSDADFLVNFYKSSLFYSHLFYSLCLFFFSQQSSFSEPFLLCQSPKQLRLSFTLPGQHRSVPCFQGNTKNWSDQTQLAGSQLSENRISNRMGLKDSIMNTFNSKIRNIRGGIESRDWGVGT